MRQSIRSALMLAFWATSAAAQKVQLELRPGAGDTLRMRLDQVTEITGTRSRGAPIVVNTTLTMFSRAIVQGTEKGATMILAVTDSIRVSSTDDRARALADQTRRQLEGRQLRLRLLPDATVHLADAPGAVSREVDDMVSVMPASFPPVPIAVGDTWMREMPIPENARMGVPVGGVVRARFRLDSLSRGGELAFVSMRGTFQPSPTPTMAATEDAARGSVNGTMVVNRKRGWLAESRFLIVMRSTLFTDGAAQRAPMRFRMRVTQHMRVLDEQRP